MSDFQRESYRCKKQLFFDEATLGNLLTLNKIIYPAHKLSLSAYTT